MLDHAQVARRLHALSALMLTVCTLPFQKLSSITDNHFVKVRPMYTTMADKNFSYNLLALNMQNGSAQKGCKCTYNLFALRFLDFFSE